MSADRKILAIDTAFAACSVAVRVSADVAFHRHEPMTTGHAERLFPLIHDVLAEANLTFQDLDAIAVTVGPGSFTGVRVGVAAARGLALAAGLPTLGATSLATIARCAAIKSEQQEVANRPSSSITVIQDARRGNVFWQDFDSQGRTPLSDAKLIPSTDLAAAVTWDKDRRLVGTAAELLHESAPDAASQTTIIEVANSDATALALTEVDLIEMKPVSPLYLRPPDAKAQVGKSLLRQSQ